jgi:tetratricopeptide (TPR) repeat protein
MNHLFRTIIFCLYSLVLPQSMDSSQVSGKSNDTLYAINFDQANIHMGQFEFEESIKSCEEALNCRPGDFLVRAIMCLDYFEIAERLNIKKDGGRNKRIKIYKKMVQIAEAGIRLAPDKGECYFMRGLANARMATTKGILSQLFTAKQIESDWLLSVNRKSAYTTPKGENLQASSCVALGVYYRLCPQFFLIRWLFGIRGDFNKAVTYCQKAHELDSTRIEIVKELGVALITRGLNAKKRSDVEEGKKYLRLVPTLPLRLQTDQIDIAHSKMLLGDIALCPGYSRDDQQDVSEYAYKKMNQ